MIVQTTEEAFSEKAIRRKNANNREFRRKRKEIRLRRPDSKAERQKRARIKIVNGFGNRDGCGKAAEPEQRARLYQIRFYRGVRSMNGWKPFRRKRGAARIKSCRKADRERRIDEKRPKQPSFAWSLQNAQEDVGTTSNTASFFTRKPVLRIISPQICIKP